MSFTEDNYLVVRNAIDSKFADFLYQYMLLQRNIAKFKFEQKYITYYTVDNGTFGDRQVPQTYGMYGDPVFDLLLEKDIRPILEKESKLNLYSTYTYYRIYKKGDVLKRHKDRPSCKISTTMNIGGDEWPIYLEPSGEKNKKGVEVNLNPGDMLMYRGCELEHWRDVFEGDDCAQVFFHFTDDKNYIYDTRPFLGLPQYFKND
tara:strand:- start:5092 stop:5700 length:609 start_codon:yes stop_codon:yes gene_type:complete